MNYLDQVQVCFFRPLWFYLPHFLTWYFFTSLLLKLQVWVNISVTINNSKRSLEMIRRLDTDAIDHIRLVFNRTPLGFLVGPIVQKFQHGESCIYWEILLKFLIQQDELEKQFRKIFPYSKSKLIDYTYTTSSIQFKQLINRQMKPRPDSAKSAKTRITLDSDINSNQLTQSRFSQTYSNGVKLNSNKNGEFEKYVAEKNKDPKFKKFLEPTLPLIPEQLKPSNQLSRLTSKPFEKKVSKNDKQKSEKKVEENPKKAEEEIKIKKQNLQNSKTFMDKSKQKFKVTSKQQIQQQLLHQKLTDPNHQQNNKPKINLNGFVLNIPGKAPQVISQQKEKHEKAQQSKKKESNERQRILTELSQYVSQIQSRNNQIFPTQYDQFIRRNMHLDDLEIDKINLNDFLDPNQRDYEKLLKQINENEKKLDSGDKFGSGSKRTISDGSSSINLQEIIDGKSQEFQQKEDQSIIMSSMTASDVKDRNMFLTQILKGRRITQQDLYQIQQNSSKIVKLIKLQGLDKEEEKQDEDLQITQINMSKKKNNRILERNKIEAAGQLYRECDYLTPQQQQRIQDLINGAQIETPFEMNEMERLINRGIDEGIKLHRQMSRQVQGRIQPIVQDISQQALPKDPILKKKAQLKILREKINSVNSRLATVNEVVINKNKIQNLINKYKQVVKPSKLSESLIQEKRRQIEYQLNQLREAENIINRVCEEKAEMQALLQQMCTTYKNLEGDAIKLQKMDSEQRKKMEEEQLKIKKRKIIQIQKQIIEFQSQITTFEQISTDIRRNMSVLDDILRPNRSEIQCEGYKQGQSIEDIDALVTKKWQSAEEALRNLREHGN